MGRNPRRSAPRPVDDKSTMGELKIETETEIEIEKERKIEKESKIEKEKENERRQSEMDDQNEGKSSICLTRQATRGVPTQVIILDPRVEITTLSRIRHQ